MMGREPSYELGGTLDSTRNNNTSTQMGGGVVIGAGGRIRTGDLFRDREAL